MGSIVDRPEINHRKPRAAPRRNRRSFTLLEFLVVVAVITVLSVIAIAVLNPSQLLMQSRDANRLSDVNNIEKAMSLYSVSYPSGLGNNSTTYFSIPDPAATSTAGTDCASLGLVPPPGLFYHCAASSTYMKIDGTGWIPINFMKKDAAVSIGGRLPTDPVNTTSSGLYYSYAVQNSTYAITARMQSSKYLKRVASVDGGFEPTWYERGTISLVQKGEGLEAWWAFDEGAGNIVNDNTYSNDTGEFLGSGPLWTSQAKVGSYAGAFNGIDNSVCVDMCTVGKSINWGKNWTFMLWIKTSQANGPFISTLGDYGGSVLLGIAGGKIFLSQSECSPSQITGTKTVNDGQYHHIVFVRRGSLNIGEIYVDGVLDVSSAQSLCVSQTTYGLRIGNDGIPSGSYFSGQLDDVRIYTRPLLAGEIANVFNYNSVQ